MIGERAQADAENGLSEALSALRGEGWHQTADNLEAWYKLLPPALDADAVATLREAAATLRESAATLRESAPPPGLRFRNVVTFVNLDALAERLCALAGDA